MVYELEITKTIRCPMSGAMIEVSTCKSCKSKGKFVYGDTHVIKYLCRYDGKRK
jgi:hypothetical protein